MAIEVDQRKPLKKQTAILGLALLAVGCFAFARTWQNNGRLSVLGCWDPQFYYAQARSILFEHDLNITSSLEASPYQEPFGPDENGYLTTPPRYAGHIVNKYPIGLSIFEIPLFGLGNAIARLSGRAGAPAGYSNPEMITVGVGLLAYAIAGLTLLLLLLQYYYSFWPSALGIIATWLGTSLFYYSTALPTMAHGTAFTLIVVILWQIEELRRKEVSEVAPFAILALSFGLLFLVRPQQILLAPITAPILVGILRRSRRPWISALLFAAVFGIVCSVQVIVNYYQVGHVSVNAYAANNEGFDWLHPQWNMVLISSIRGIFWINPIVWLALFALGYYRPSCWIEYVLLAHGAVQLYIIACWSCPNQGQSFGPRMWVESTPLVAFGIAKLFTHVKPSLQMWVFSAYMAALAWTILLLGVYLRDGMDTPIRYWDMVQMACGLKLR